MGTICGGTLPGLYPPSKSTLRVIKGYVKMGLLIKIPVLLPCLE